RVATTERGEERTAIVRRGDASVRAGYAEPRRRLTETGGAAADQDRCETPAGEFGDHEPALVATCAVDSDLHNTPPKSCSSTCVPRYGGGRPAFIRQRRRCIRGRLDTSCERYIGPVDVLSDAVNAMRTGRPHSARVRQPAAFSHRLAAVDGAGFHAVLQGACWLIPPDGPPIALRAGDIAFLPSGCAHGLADRRPGDGAPPVPVDSDRSHRGETATGLPCRASLLGRSEPYPM